jgi:7-cyano-7-deazaguanine synthase
MEIIVADTQMDGNSMKSVVMALSGGMDSTCLLMHYLARGYNAVCISYNYGQKHSIELERAKATISMCIDNGLSVSHHIVDLAPAMSLFDSALTSKEQDVPLGHYEEDQMKQTVVPNRNAIFASILYGFALSETKRTGENVVLALGVHSGDHAIYPDCRPEFYEALQHAFEIGNWDSERVDFDLPYLHGNKTSILQDAIESCTMLGFDFDVVLRNTITSYNPDSEGRSSGKSGSDIERILAFHEINRRDPITYQDTWEKVLEHALLVESKHQAGGIQ